MRVPPDGMNGCFQWAFPVCDEKRTTPRLYWNLCLRLDQVAHFLVYCLPRRIKVSVLVKNLVLVGKIFFPVQLKFASFQIFGYSNSSPGDFGTLLKHTSLQMRMQNIERSLGLSSVIVCHQRMTFHRNNFSEITQTIREMADIDVWCDEGYRLADRSASCVIEGMSHWHP